MLSIVTIVLNQELYIEETILSVTNQKTSQIEYIIIDGGSTDETLNIINKYKHKIDVIISEKDDGIYAAINKGIKRCRNELIGLIHAGDSYCPGILKKIIDHHVCGKVVVYYGNMFLLNVKNGAKIKSFADSSFLLRRMSIFHPSTFIPRSLYMKYGLYETKYRIVSDYNLFLKLRLKGVSFEKINDFISVFRSDGISSQNIFLKFKELFLVRLSHFSFFYAFKLFFYELLKVIFFYTGSFIFNFLKKIRIILMKSILITFYLNIILFFFVFNEKP